MTATEALIRGYYDAFNRGDMAGFLALLTDDVIHDVSQGGREIGRCCWRAIVRSGSTLSATISASSRMIGRARRSAPGASAGRSGAMGWR